jgi:predicted DNA binding protein
LRTLEDKGFVFDVARKIPFDGFVAISLTITADAVFSNLTEKQMDAPMTAYSHGYYRLPRKVNVQTIAHQRRLPTTTFQEHPKKAENKLIVSLVSYIQLFKKTPEKKRKSLKMK